MNKVLNTCSLIQENLDKAIGSADRIIEKLDSINDKYLYFLDDIPFGKGYAIDREGNVYSYKSKKPRQLKARKHWNKGGYIYKKVVFSQNNRKKEYYIHQLYQHAFGEKYNYKTKGKSK